MPAQYTNPRFNPAEHGFHFINAFENTIYISPFGSSIKTGGRCGGMSYSALDYFNANQKPIPQTNETPPDGDYIGDYILKRQWDTFASVADEFITGTLFPNGGDMFYGRCYPQIGQDFNQFVSNINQNKPCNLGLFSTKGGIQNIGNCHQVLGIGYTKNSDPEKVLIHIYDPNKPDKEMVLRLNISKKLWEECPYDANANTSQQVGSVYKSWKAWFADIGYKKHAVPSDTSTSIKDCSGKDLRHWKPPRSENLRAYRFVGTIFSGSGALDSCDFFGVVARRAIFNNASASQSSFLNSDLCFAQFDGANLKGSTFDQAKLLGAVFSRADLSDACFVDCKGIFDSYRYAKVNFASAKFNNTNMKGAILPVSNFGYTSMLNTQMNGVNLYDSDFRFSSLNNVNFSSTKERTSDLYSTDFRNASLKSCRFDSTKLARSDFSNISISSCSFKASNANRTKFTNCSIANTSFTDSDLSLANFSGAALNNVDLSKIDYEGSNWQGASLSHCKMTTRLMSHIISRGGRVS